MNDRRNGLRTELLINANACISGHVSLQQLKLPGTGLIPVPQNIFN